MTDFIHEQPKEANAPAAPIPEQTGEPEELDEQSGRKRVYGYILLLFIVAFSLLLWSFLMNQRSNEEVLTELRGSASSLQSTLERNIELEKQADALQAENTALSDRVEALEAEKAALEKQAAEAERQQAALAEAAFRVQAMDDLLGMEEAMRDGNTDLARAYADALAAPAQSVGENKSDKPLSDYLPTATERQRVSGDREPNAAELYAALLEKLG